jgi:methyltransferase
MLHAALFLAAYLPMVLEAAVSARNDRRLRAAGAIEPHDDVFKVMQFVYPFCFAAMLGESVVVQRHAPGALAAGLIVFAAAKALKYWAVAALGVRWTFRVLVPPNSSLIQRGPYRFMRHPNYAAVVGELAGFALMAAAPISGVAMLIVFVSLMRARVRVEERALGLR